ncbi:sulfite exporter TauE/SafE family protein [Streptomyces sp. MNU76]|uniref:sulfite exporter TauE/SafE family protein n=1 Tax=Streptomyces sp. MNU76 TaxID=2560026 RepID=UPI0035A98AFD
MDGIAVGLVTGLVGAGGGFLVVPALALLGGLPMGVAVGTSLLVITVKSFAGLAGYLAVVHIDWGFAALVTSVAVVGGLLGGRLAGRIPQETLRKSFGWFVAVMGALVLGLQIPPGLRQTLLTSPWTWSAVAAAAVALGVRHLLRGTVPRPVHGADGRSPAEGERAVPRPPREPSVDRVGSTASLGDA